jgi:hypothetical protein
MKMFFEVLLVLVVVGVSVLMVISAMRDALRRAKRPYHQWTKEEQSVLITNRERGHALFIVIVAFVLYKGGHWLIQMAFR